MDGFLDDQIREADRGFSFTESARTLKPKIPQIPTGIAARFAPVITKLTAYVEEHFGEKVYGSLEMSEPLFLDRVFYWYVTYHTASDSNMSIGIAYDVASNTWGQALQSGGKAKSRLRNPYATQDEALVDFKRRVDAIPALRRQEIAEHPDKVCRGLALSNEGPQGSLDDEEYDLLQETLRRVA